MIKEEDLDNMLLTDIKVNLFLNNQTDLTLNNTILASFRAFQEQNDGYLTLYLREMYNAFTLIRLTFRVRDFFINIELVNATYESVILMRGFKKQLKDGEETVFCNFFEHFIEYNKFVYTFSNVGNEKEISKDFYFLEHGVKRKLDIEDCGYYINAGFFWEVL